MTSHIGPGKWENTHSLFDFVFLTLPSTQNQLDYVDHLMSVSKWMRIFMSRLKQFFSVHFFDSERLCVPSSDIIFPTEIACHHFPSSRMTNYELES